MAEVTFHIK